MRFGERIGVVGGISVRLQRSGHIPRRRIGAGGSTQQPPDPPGAADHIVFESTYGDREHEHADAQARLGDVIVRTAARGGTVVIPAFAVGRAQALLYAIHHLKASRAIPDLPVFLNSPMAGDMTAIYHRHRMEHRLTPEAFIGMCRAATVTRDIEASRRLDRLRHPAVILSASGMATGGRVLHHLQALAPNPRNTIVLAGYQAAGTRGARLQAGERSLSIHGEDVPVRAEVVSLPDMSAHADARQIDDWLRSAPRPPRTLWLTHGEPTPADALRLRIERELGWDARVPMIGQGAMLSGASQPAEAPDG